MSLECLSGKPRTETFHILAKQPGLPEFTLFQAMLSMGMHYEIICPVIGIDGIASASTLLLRATVL